MQLCPPAGSDAAHWFTNNMEGIQSPQQALNVGQRLVDLDIITEIQGNTNFVLTML